jgi:hypothetical protein
MSRPVKSAHDTIVQFWPKHADHTTKSRTRAPRWSTAEGVVCACGDVLGWPDPDHHETLSQYTKRTAQEQVDAAIEEGKITRGTAKVKGAFGEYAAQQPSEPSTQDHPDGDLQPSTVDADQHELDETYDTEPLRSDDDPGPEEPPELDWGEPPEDEPEPVVLTVDRDTPKVRDVQLPDAIEDGDSEDVGTAPIPADAVPDERGNMISGGQSYGQPSGPVDFGKLVDETTGPETVFEADADLYPDEAQAGPPYAVGDTVTVAGVEFVKHSESPFPEHNAPTLADAAGQVADDGPPWDAYEDHGGGPKPSNEGIPEEPEVGRDLVPFAGTPLMPTDSDSMDPLNRALPPLDPTLPYTPADVELKILEVLQQGERGERFLREQLARLHQAQHNLDLRYNLAIAASDSRAADQRKAEAWIATEKERFEATQAEMLVRALRDNLHNLRAQLSGFQSVARSLGVSLTNSLDGRDMPKRIESHREPPPVSPWEYQ